MVAIVVLLPASPGLAAPSAATVPAGSGAVAVRADGRSADFDHGWGFPLVNPAGIDDPTGAYAHAADPGFDDASWRAVDLPHDWSIERDPTPDGGTDAGTGFLQGGLG